MNKLRKRTLNTSGDDNISNQYMEDYKLYFDNALNKTKYQDKYNSNINGECVILDVSEFNQKNGDEKWITTLPNSNIELLSVIALDFGKNITNYWIVEDKEELAIKSHDKFKISPLYHLGILQRYGIDNIEIDTKVMDSETDTTTKKIYFSPKVFNIQRGDLLVYNDANKTYLAKEVQNFTSYPFAKSEECNHLFKWMNQGKYFEQLGVANNQTEYTAGIKDQTTAGITEVEAIYHCFLPDNEITRNINLDTRFILNENAWRVTQVDYTSTLGLFQILLGKDSVNNQVDDLKNELADAFSYLYSITLSSTSQILEVSGTYEINATVMNNNKLVSNPNITWTSSATTIATVNNGLVTAIGVGNCIISANIGSVTATLSLIVNAKTSTNVTSYQCKWSTGGTTDGVSLKTYMSSIASISKTVDSVIDSSLDVTYTLDSVGTDLATNKLISITKQSNNTFLVKNLKVNTAKSFNIQFINSADNSVITTQKVSLSGM
jgi:hypothetical protein